MIITCPKCGEKIVVDGLGRKPLNIPLKNIYDAIQACGSVAGAASKLGCSSAYIFKVLKDNGMNLKELRGQQKRQSHMGQGKVGQSERQAKGTDQR